MAKVLHVLWLLPEDYPRFRDIFDDVDDTYEEWRERMERRLAEVREDGVEIDRVLIKPDELIAWCREYGREIDANARAVYPAIIAAMRDRSD